ncbi:MAG: DUF1553 domain-containing protein [Planctomycetia bacterium]|nr:DUF1553 domain-containing protein [Planctomycetia bacterium]
MTAPLPAALALFLGLWTIDLDSPAPQRAVRQPAAVAALIDREIDKQLAEAKIPASPPADDAEFLRRACLDITGRLPAPEKVIAFLDSQEPDKRRRLLDDLLNSSDYGQHFATLWRDRVAPGMTLDANLKNGLQQWLAGRFNENAGWDRVVAELLTAEAGPPTAFVLAQSDNNQLQPNLLASATARLFLGVQLQCAECHHHPFSDWKQADFWGLAAFFGRVKRQPAQAKGAPGGLTEAAVATDKKGPPPMPPGNFIVLPPTAGKGAGKRVPAKFLGADAPDLPGEGAIRPKLAAWLTATENPFFAEAAVNRLWAHFFGRGLVDPVDDFSDTNPPSHPELLRELAAEFRASGFDLKHLARCITASRAYQRTSRPLPENQKDKTLVSRPAVKVFTPEMHYDALTAALGLPALKIDPGKAISAEGRSVKTAGSPRDSFAAFFRTQDSDAGPTDYTHGIPQALSLMNDPEFNRGTYPAVEQLVKANLPPEKALEALYLRTLSRRPTEVESKLLRAYLARQPDAAKGYAGVLWILVNAQEFVLNH